MDDEHEAHTRLTAELKVGLQVQPSKSYVYSEQPAQSQQLAADLGVKPADRGLWWQVALWGSQASCRSMSPLSSTQ